MIRLKIVPKKVKPIGSVEVVGFTHRGKMRRKHEDAFILGKHVQPAPAPYPIITEQNVPLDGSIVAVIDGMGGLGGGDLAATWLAERWAPRKVRSDGGREFCTTSPGGRPKTAMSSSRAYSSRRWRSDF